MRVSRIVFLLDLFLIPCSLRPGFHPAQQLDKQHDTRYRKHGHDDKACRSAAFGAQLEYHHQLHSCKHGQNQQNHCNMFAFFHEFRKIFLP